MKFEKRNFMGIELDVLVGHPEHDLLFVATQVARSAGLKDPGSSIRTSKRRLPDGSVQLSSLTALSAASLPKVTGALQWRDALRVLDSVQDSPNASDFAKVMRKQNQGITLLDVASQILDYRVCGPKDISGRALQLRAPLLTEANVYQFLLKGHAPQSEPFRKWVTEEVLPTIRNAKRKNLEGCLYLSGLMDKSSMSLPKEPNGASLRTTTVLMTEAKVYDMMLKGKAPQTEPFRKWVTEEVLPTIRKTGSYNAEESTNPIAVGLMDELKALRGTFLREI